MQPVISMEPLCRKQSKPPLPAARRMGKTAVDRRPPETTGGSNARARWKAGNKGHASRD